jgi:hypothetical protein
MYTKNTRHVSNRFTSFDNRFTAWPTLVSPRAVLLSLRAWNDKTCCHKTNSLTHLEIIYMLCHVYGEFSECRFCFLIYCSGVRLTPLDTSATNWPYCTNPRWLRSTRNLVEWEMAGETEVLGSSLCQCHSSITNPTWPKLGSNLSQHSWKPAINHLSYGTALSAELKKEFRQDLKVPSFP